MDMISIICIYDNRRVYNERLGQSLVYLEDCAYELIVKKRVGSYIGNLHEAIQEASNDLVLIVNENCILPNHFISDLETFEDISFGVVGIVGRKKKIVTEGICNIVGNSIFMIRKSDYLQNPFDETCKQHYLIDYCYAMKNLKKDNYVLKVDVNYQPRQKDDPIVISYLRHKYHTELTIDTLNDYYPTRLDHRIIKKAARIYYKYK